MEKIWLKSYAKTVPEEISFENITLDAALKRSASRFPDKPALLFHGTEITFKELDEMVSRFASVLVALGIKPGDRGWPCSCRTLSKWWWPRTEGSGPVR